MTSQAFKRDDSQGNLRKREKKQQAKKELNERKVRILKGFILAEDGSNTLRGTDPKAKNNHSSSNGGSNQFDQTFKSFKEKVAEYTKKPQNKGKNIVDALLGEGNEPGRNFNQELVKKVVEKFKLESKEQAEKVLRLRNELRIVEKVVSKVKKVKKQAYLSGARHKNEQNDIYEQVRQYKNLKRQKNA